MKEPSKRLCLKNGTVITNGLEIKTDILVEHGKIAALGNSQTFDLSGETEVIDCAGKIILPGIIDAHCHIQLDTGIFQTPDNWAIGSREAARGGITTVIDFVGPEPGEDLHHALDFRLTQAKPSIIDYTFHLTALDDTPQTLDAILKCPSWGITSLKIYTTYRPNYYLSDEAIVHILECAAKAGLAVLVHCENDAIVTNETAKLGQDNLWRNYPKLRPAIAETEAAARIIRLAEYTGAHVVIAHNSSDATVDVVREARARGLNVHNETGPQYLFLSEEDNYKNPEPWRFILQPPLRSTQTRDRLCRQAAAGDIDMAITDQCSYTRDQKCHAPTGTPGGLPGFETLLPLTAAVPGMTWTRVVRMLCQNPAQIYGLWPRKGDILPGFDADLVIIRDEAFTIDESKLHAFAGYSPFNGHKARGIVERVFRRGEEIVRHGELNAEDGTGVFCTAGAPCSPTRQAAGSVRL